MNNNTLWGFPLPSKFISHEEFSYLNRLPQNLPTVEWVCNEIDRVWNTFELNNKTILMAQQLGDFYRHPVWIMNGIFTAVDNVSSKQRAAIAEFLSKASIKSVADFGGGFGELALALSKANPIASISIIEPYPSLIGLERIKEINNINIVSNLDKSDYDAIIAQDILEHVEDPIELAYQISSSVHEGGYIIFANCFYPVIQCHLPITFHLRHTFPSVMKALGLDYIGTVPGVLHAQIYVRNGTLNFSKARRAERLSKFFGPMLNILKPALSKIKLLFLRK